MELQWGVGTGTINTNPNDVVNIVLYNSLTDDFFFFVYQDAPSATVLNKERKGTSGWASLFMVVGAAGFSLFVLRKFKRSLK